ncbi:hypothetical protein D9M70_418500 [compost metagenome]
MAVGGVDDDQVDAGVDQPLGALKAVIADRDGGGGAKAALRVLGGVRVELRLLDVLDGDQADAAAVGVDDQKLLDAVRVKEALGFLLVDAFLDRDQVLMGHQLVDLLVRVGSEADVTVGEDADETTLLLATGAAVLDDRDAGNAVLLHEAQRIGELGVGADGHRIDDHAAFELLDLTNLFGLLGRRQVAVDDADAAGLCHGDREAPFGHRVHRRRQDRQVEVNVLRNGCCDIGLTRHDFGMSGQEQDVVEGQSLQTSCRFDDARHGQFPSINENPRGRAAICPPGDFKACLGSWRGLVTRICQDENSQSLEMSRLRPIFVAEQQFREMQPLTRLDTDQISS